MIMNERPVVIFDLDGTLVYTAPRMIDEFNRLVMELSTKPISPENIRQTERWNHYYWMPSQEFLDDLKASNGQQDRPFWLRYAMRHLDLLGIMPIESNRFTGALIDRLLVFTQTVLRKEEFFEDAAPAIQRLFDAGYRLALLTNRSPDMFPPIVLNGLARYFESVLSAGEIGYWKPDPQIFKAMLSRLDVDPESAVYIGDNYYSDVLGAYASGLRPILIDRRNLFPEAECQVIKSLSTLSDIFVS
jgi:HAD superfamily hydrolase (TIGR01549 family)